MNMPPAAQRKHPGFQPQQQRNVFHSTKQTAGREEGVHYSDRMGGKGTTDADAENMEDQKQREYRG